MKSTVEKMRGLTEDCKQKIKDKVQSLERLTSVEFVPVFVPRTTNLPWFMRRITPRKYILNAVQMAAHMAFLQYEVFATKERTGVLIFVSEWEQAVFVLADKGLLNHIPSSEWADLGAELAKDFESLGTKNTFLSALDRISERLGRHFPPAPQNANELPDDVRL